MNAVAQLRNGSCARGHGVTNLRNPRIKRISKGSGSTIDWVGFTIDGIGGAAWHTGRRLIAVIDLYLYRLKQFIFQEEPCRWIVNRDTVPVTEVGPSRGCGTRIRGDSIV